MDNHSPVGMSLQIRDERGALPCGVHAESRVIFPRCVYTNCSSVLRCARGLELDYHTLKPRVYIVGEIIEVVGCWSLHGIFRWDILRNMALTHVAKVRSSE
jgi:hypothetical protein